MLVHCRVIHSFKLAGTHLYTWVERDTVRVKCLALACMQPLMSVRCVWAMSKVARDASASKVNWEPEAKALFSEFSALAYERSNYSDWWKMTGPFSMTKTSRDYWTQTWLDVREFYCGIYPGSFSKTFQPSFHLVDLKHKQEKLWIVFQKEECFAVMPTRYSNWIE